ncbi:MAG: UdgX family uracil-DNA binding protein [Actinobacteria bacterium]|nr:UdgX family uracil-DNA binding protein [Actinomycetota bacterium]
MPAADVDTAAPLVPEGADLDELRDAAASCTACDLHLTGTQTVFGEGPPDADLIVVGEQPGDEEDREGEPFVGPAGRELDRGLEAVGIDRDRVYVTNTVKHFKWSEQRGKRRIHQKPNTIEIRSCLPWLRAEIAVTRPSAVVALGSTAAKALLGSDFRVTRQRGELHPGPDGTIITATVHPASILRSRTDEERYAARAAFHDDLRRIAALLEKGVTAALTHATVDELYARAQELDVSGRSSMDKAALVEAVAAALSRP